MEELSSRRSYSSAMDQALFELSRLSRRNGAGGHSIAAYSMPASYRAGIRGTWMRVHMIVAGLILAIIGKANATVVDKGTDAQKSCELLVKNSPRNQDEARSAGVCEGMIETAMLFSPNLPADVRACPRARQPFAKCEGFSAVS